MLWIVDLLESMFIYCELFHDILIYWDAPAYVCMCVYVYIYNIEDTSIVISFYEM